MFINTSSIAADRNSLKLISNDGIDSKSLKLDVVDSIDQFTFYRGEMEVTLLSIPSVVRYSVNGALYSFKVPAAGGEVKIFYCSCNGFSGKTVTFGSENGGISNTWQHVLENNVYHVGIGGGDQLYCDEVFDLPVFNSWLRLDDQNNFKEMYSRPFTSDMSAAVLNFYLNNYMSHFSNAALADCLSSIPMINQWDDHDIYDGYGSYPPSEQNCPVMQGVYRIARRLYLLFQHHMREDEAVARGYFNILPSISTLKTFSDVAVLSLDERSERSKKQVIAPSTYREAFARLEQLPSSCRHLLVLLGVPVMSNDLSAVADVLSKFSTEHIQQKVHDLEHSQKHLKSNQREKRLRMFLSETRSKIKIEIKGGIADELKLKNIFGNISLLDDLADSYDDEEHKDERSSLLRDLVEFSVRKRIRVTILSGDVHFANASHLPLPGHAGHLHQLVSSPIGNEVNASIKIIRALFNDCASVKLADGTELCPRITGWGEGFIEGRNYLELQVGSENSDLNAILHVEKDTNKTSNFASFEYKISAF